MKKVLSLVVVIGMILSSLTFVSAGTFTDVPEDNAKLQGAVELLAALGISNGYELSDGSFEYRPEKTLKRCELVKLLVEALGYGKFATGVPSFTDCQGHWAKGYIAIAETCGLVQGTGNGLFNPERQVKYSEAVTMFLRALGYTNSNINNGVNAYNLSAYTVKAMDNGVIGVLDTYVASAPANRGDVALMLQQLLKCTMVRTQEGVAEEIVKSNKPVILLSKVAKEVTTKAGDPVFVDEDLVEEQPILADYLYQSVIYYTDKNDKAVYVAYSDSKVADGIITSAGFLTNNKGTIEIYDFGCNDYVDYNMDSDVNVKYNGVQRKYSVENQMLTSNSGTKYGSLAGSSVKLVYSVENKRKVVAGMIVEQETDDKFISKTYKKNSVLLNGIILPKNPDTSKVDLSKVIVTGAVSDIYDIAKKDVVKAYQAKDNNGKVIMCKLLVVRDSVEGMIRETKTTNNKHYAYIDTLGEFKRMCKKDMVEVKSEGTFYFDENGFIYAFEGTNAMEESDYALVLGKADQIKVNSNNVDHVIRDAYFEVLNTVGQKVKYLVDKDTKYAMSNDLKTEIDVLNANGVVNKLDENIIVKSVKMDTNGEYAELVVLQDLGHKTSIDASSRSFYSANNIVVFNTVGTNNNYTGRVNTLDDLIAKGSIGGNGVDVWYVKNANREYELVLVVGQEIATSQTNYALITGVKKVINDDGDVVCRITYLNDGEESVVDTTKDVKSVTMGVNLVTFSMKGDLVTAVNPIKVTDTNCTLYSNSTTSTVISYINDARLYDETASKDIDVDADCVVYVFNSDDHFVRLGSLDEITNDQKIYVYTSVIDGETLVTEVIIREN